MTLDIINSLTSSQLASNGLPGHYCFILPSLHLPQKQPCSPIHSYLSSQMAVKTRTGPGSMRKGINGFLAQPASTTAISHIRKREKKILRAKECLECVVLLDRRKLCVCVTRVSMFLDPTCIRRGGIWG